MMKTFLYSFFWLVIISCNQAKTKATLKEVNLTDTIFSDTDSVFGSWTMCSIVSDGQMIQMNTCPIVTFKRDGIGYVLNQTSISNIFKRRLTNSGMKVSYNNPDSNATFPDTNYYAYFFKEKNMMTLSLRHNEQTFYLNRSVDAR